MHKISFRSDAPADHLCRALDVARKMGFELERLHVEPAGKRTYAISLTLANGSPAAVSTMLARVALCIGTDDVRHETMRAAEAPHSHR